MGSKGSHNRQGRSNYVIIHLNISSKKTGRGPKVMLQNDKQNNKDIAVVKVKLS